MAEHEEEASGVAAVVEELRSQRERKLGTIKGEQAARKAERLRLQVKPHFSTCFRLQLQTYVSTNDTDLL